MGGAIFNLLLYVTVLILVLFVYIRIHKYTHTKINLTKKKIETFRSNYDNLISNI